VDAKKLTFAKFRLNAESNERLSRLFGFFSSFDLPFWNTALDTLSGRNIGLDGVLSQQKNYQKSGFRFAYHTIRYESVAEVVSISHPGIVQLSKIPFEIIAAYDQPFFPGDRAQFLRCWINQPNCIALGILQNNTLAGYGVNRLFGVTTFELG